jgi:hypothetical protein
MSDAGAAGGAKGMAVAAPALTPATTAASATDLIASDLIMIIVLQLIRIV